MIINVVNRVNAKGVVTTHSPTCRHRGDVVAEVAAELHTLLLAPRKVVADCAQTLATEALAELNPSEQAEVMSKAVA